MWQGLCYEQYVANLVDDMGQIKVKYARGLAAQRDKHKFKPVNNKEELRELIEIDVRMSIGYYFLNLNPL